MTKRKKGQERRTVPSCFVFTPETVTLVQEALRVLEEPLARVQSHDAKTATIREVLASVREKFRSMNTLGSMLLTTFDYNERLIVAAAVEMYLFDVWALPPGPARTRKIQQCGYIQTGFSFPEPKGKTDHVCSRVGKFFS
jgi:hypothetical protein